MQVHGRFCRSHLYHRCHIRHWCGVRPPVRQRRSPVDLAGTPRRTARRAVRSIGCAGAHFATRHPRPAGAQSGDRVPAGPVRDDRCPGEQCWDHRGVWPAARGRSGRLGRRRGHEYQGGPLLHARGAAKHGEAGARSHYHHRLAGCATSVPRRQRLCWDEGIRPSALVQSSGRSARHGYPHHVDRAGPHAHRGVRRAIRW